MALAITWPMRLRKTGSSYIGSSSYGGSVSEALFHQLLACPVDHGWAGIQSLCNLAVTPSIPTFRDIGLEQCPRLQQPLRGALPFPNQRFKPFAFLATQPHHIFLYRNLLCSHDRLRRQ